MTSSVPGYEAEQHEVQAVLDALVGSRDPGDDQLAWYTHLSSRQALLAAAAERIADDRARVAAELYRDLGETRSYGRLAALLGTSRSRAQQWVERARALDNTTTSES